jgi:hypothetical protein
MLITGRSHSEMLNLSRMNLITARVTRLPIVLALLACATSLRGHALTILPIVTNDTAFNPSPNYKQ